MLPGLPVVSVQRKALGRELFELVAKTLGIREVTYFGLSYVDVKGYRAWLKDDKRVSGGVLLVLFFHPSPAHMGLHMQMCGLGYLAFLLHRQVSCS